MRDYTTIRGGFIPSGPIPAKTPYRPHPEQARKRSFTGVVEKVLQGEVMSQRAPPDVERWFCSSLLIVIPAYSRNPFADAGKISAAFHSPPMRGNPDERRKNGFRQTLPPWSGLTPEWRQTLPHRGFSTAPQRCVFHCRLRCEFAMLSPFSERIFSLHRHKFSPG